MKYLKIKNNGILDIRLVALMGGTTKSTDKYKIGQFGTGLKYTLAYLYRNNIDFKLFCGKDEVEISLVQETIGEMDFNIICINGNRTSITTQMGSNWTAWMIIRELWCNALDEGGAQKLESYTDPIGEENTTSFFIQVTPEIEDVLKNWDSYFIHNRNPLFEDENYGIYKGDGKLKLYKQGVLIYQHHESVGLFNYDIKGAEINELREFKGLVSLEVLNALRSPSKEVINYFFKNIKETHYEGVDMDYEWYHTFGDIWKQALEGQKIVSYDTVRYVEQNGIDQEDLAKAIQLPKKVYAALTKAFEGVGALRSNTNGEDFYEIKATGLEEKTTDCLTILKDAGYSINDKLKIIYGLFEKKNVLVSLNRQRCEILVSDRCLNLETSELTCLLVEKNEMFNSRENDCTRQFQNHIIKLFVDSLMKIEA